MSPVAGKGSSNLRTTVLVALGALVAAGALLLLVVAMSDSGRVELRIGDERFNAGDAKNFTAVIAEDGPILYPDVGTGQRDVFVQHIGDDWRVGWHVFDARRPQAADRCVLQWVADDREFEDPCDGTRVPADGGDLPSYPVAVDEGDVLVDLAS